MTDARIAAARSLAARALAAVHAAGADAADCHATVGHAALTRFAEGAIGQSVAADVRRVAVRAVVGRRVAVAVGEGSAADDVAALAERAVALARRAPEADAPIPLGDPTPGARAPRAGPEADDPTPEDRAAGVRAIVAAAADAGARAAGSWRTEGVAVAVAGSAGIERAELRTEAAALVVATGPVRTGYAARIAASADALDGAVLGREAGARAAGSEPGITLPPGDYPVVLGPYAVADIVATLGWLGLNGRAVEEERSFHAPGTRIAAPTITLTDEPADPAGLPIGFDGEGTPTHAVTLIAAGICRDIVHDAATDARAGVASTGHALPAPNPWGPLPTRLVLASGDATDAELLAGIRRGLLVTRFHYTNPAHPRRAIVTGMTRDGLFLVEDGQVVAPVRDLRFTTSYLDALAAVSAVGRDRLLVATETGCARVPALRVDGFRFTGVAGA
ncbi:MAG: TldD/PmbA family protein [Chloroflexota bacterium]